MRGISAVYPGTIRADICVIGAGSAGLSVASGAAQMGARTVLIEADRMGGDCLNTGCVPSKSLLAAAKAAHAAKEATRFGVLLAAPDVDFTKVRDYVHGVISNIAPHDSVERFTALGCTVIKARGRFLDGSTVEAGGTRIRARRFVIATGSRAAVPSIPGLSDVPYLTNETLFDNAVLPRHLVVIGAGPIGCEMAQAHRRLGSQVTVLDLGQMLPKDDPDAVAVIRTAFAAEGILVAERVKILRIEKRAHGIAVALADDGGERWIEGSHLLVAAGRAPTVEGLGLEAAGIRFGPKGIDVDARLRSSNRRVYAAGDVAGSYQFTHLASYHAGIILRNALFRLPARTDLRALPWVTYTDPELAQVGVTEAQARQAHGDRVRVLHAELTDNDRAQTESATQGMIKVMVSKRGRVLGATVVGRHAGELALPWVLSLSRGLGIGAMATAIAPYPTFSEICKRAAGDFYAPKLFSRRTRALVRLLGLFG
ncbi:MAG TPA: FAD-dependent oxidoreductase [Candidatus Binataceae bacterium]|nr:FAD-dependent oxidoreductase [Candidatus Binataceae bacterium]